MNWIHKLVDRIAGRKEEPYMPKILTASDLIKRIQQEPQKSKRLKIIEQFRTSFGLRTLLQMNFNPDLEFNLPPGMPQIDRQTESDVPSSSIDYVMKAVPGYTNKKASQLKLEMGWLSMLESLSPEDGLLLVQAKDKAIPDLGLDQKDLHEIFPNLIPAPESGRGIVSLPSEAEEPEVVKEKVSKPKRKRRSKAEIEADEAAAE